eukprot:SAG11_NODE_33600_length_276_cov_0.875706_2_plen_22_part_01
MYIILPTKFSRYTVYDKGQYDK